MRLVNPQEYGPAFAGLLTERLQPLGPGTPNESARADLDALTVESAFGGANLADPKMAEACISAAWLYHDFLDESHTLSQQIETPTGSYWHGIMHRREPDASNASYWFRKVGKHPVFEPLHAEAVKVAEETEGRGVGFLEGQAAWDPFVFIDLCEDARQGITDNSDLCRAVQQVEFELLFDWCYRKALGTE